MLVDSRRGLLVSGALVAGGVLVGALLALPVTRPAVDAVDRAVWEVAGAVENGPSTAGAVALSWLGSGSVNWPLRAAAVLLLAWQRHWVRLTAFVLAVLTSDRRGRVGARLAGAAHGGACAVYLVPGPGRMTCGRIAR